MRVATEGGARMMRGAKEPISRLVIFRLVWDFGGRLFDLFLEPLFGLKSRPFLIPKAVPNQRENYQSRPSHPRNILHEKVEKTVFVLWLKRRRRQWKEQHLECKEWQILGDAIFSSLNSINGT